MSGDAAAARGRNGPLAVCMLLLACAVLAAGGCSGGPDKVTLRVLAGPELADVRPLLKDLARHRCHPRHRLHRHPPTSPTVPPTIWRGPPPTAPSCSPARRLGRAGPAPESTTIMRSPVVVGVDADAARRLRARTGGGRRPGPTSPTPPPTARSASGCRTPGAATPAAPPSSASPPRRPAPASALRVQDVSCDRLRGFKSGQVMTGPTTADLIDAYVRRPDRADALIAHENELLALNAAGRLAHPLTIVPARGRHGPVRLPAAAARPGPARRLPQGRRLAARRRRAAAADADHVAPPGRPGPAAGARAEGADRQRPVLPRPAFRRRPAARGLRRPGPRRHLRPHRLPCWTSPRPCGARGSPRCAPRSPDSAAPTGRPRASSPASTGGERITVVRFGGTVLDERTVTVRGRRDLDALDSLVARGDFANATAVWSALDHGRAVAARSLAEDPGRPVAIVLMTDGASNAGISYAEFTARAAGQPRTPTYPVPIGEADTAALAPRGPGTPAAAPSPPPRPPPSPTPSRRSVGVFDRTWWSLWLWPEMALWCVTAALCLVVVRYAAARALGARRGQGPEPGHHPRPVLLPPRAAHHEPLQVQRLPGGHGTGGRRVDEDQSSASAPRPRVPRSWRGPVGWLNDAGDAHHVSEGDHAHHGHPAADGHPPQGGQRRRRGPDHRPADPTRRLAHVLTGGRRGRRGGAGGRRVTSSPCPG